MTEQRKQISFLLAESIIEKITNNSLEQGMNRNQYLEMLVTEAMGLKPNKSFDKPLPTKPEVKQGEYGSLGDYLPSKKKTKLLPMTTRVTGQMAALHQMLSKADYEQTLDGVTYYFCQPAYMIYTVDDELSRSGQVKYRIIMQHVEMQDLNMRYPICFTDVNGEYHEVEHTTFMMKDKEGYHVPDTCNDERRTELKNIYHARNIG